ncbi:ATP-grasp ribosomal peptide maturase [Dictyobacter sp. S3.2.2.5]|uniref:ATP-grasp ribosomal peptide maturase n=1 Tax=Dictyobacter halimunensis TaxID=3026934 RepID=A0ABQ6FNJ5_9CHLR|nr:ATP-grasp ribosomal peptide maturase [Dictyobacter sp. S3.2.2.5]
MGKKQIVIVSQVDEIHADEIILQLNAMGHEPIRLNSDDIPTALMASLSLENHTAGWAGSMTILTNGRRIDVEAIRSIWWWRPGAFRLPADLSVQEREFARDEIEHMFQGIWAALPCHWVSHPEHIRRASWKADQLLQATRLGFDIPRSLMTMNPDAARSFCESCVGKRALYKVLSDPFLAATTVAEKYPEHMPEYGVASTTLITSADFSMLDGVRNAPCLFQEYLPRVLDIRVTVIGDDLFAAEIHSQDHEETKIDWRYSDANIVYRKIALPAEVAERCMALVRHYNLHYCTLDLFLTPDGRYVFTEASPYGQFLFVEERVPELRMTEALANYLARGAQD